MSVRAVCRKGDIRIGMIGMEPGNIERLTERGKPFILRLDMFRDCQDVVLVYGKDHADIMQKMALFNNEPGAEIDWL